MRWTSGSSASALRNSSTFLSSSSLLIATLTISRLPHGIARYEMSALLNGSCPQVMRTETESAHLEPRTYPASSEGPAARAG